MEERKLIIDYRDSLTLFEKAMKKFQLKKIIYRTLFRGKGLEFDGYRYFTDDDDYDSIDWKASLRAGQKMVKQYKEERDVDVYFLVDCSESMLFGSGNKLKAEYVGEMVCVLTDLVLNSGDRAGLIMFSDNLVKFVKSSQKKENLFIFHKFLSDLSLYKGIFNLESCLKFAFNVAKGNTNSFILFSDLIHFKKEYINSLNILFQKGDFFSVMVRDVFDEVLMKGLKISVKDPKSKEVVVIDSNVARKIYQINALRQKNILKKVFLEKGIDLLELKTNESFVLPLSNFMKKRAEELRI